MSFLPAMHQITPPIFLCLSGYSAFCFFTLDDWICYWTVVYHKRTSRTYHHTYKCLDRDWITFWLTGTSTYCLPVFRNFSFLFINIYLLLPFFCFIYIFKKSVFGLSFYTFLVFYNVLVVIAKRCNQLKYGSNK